MKPSPPAYSQPPRRLTAVILFLLGVAVAAAYSPSLSGPFALDDTRNIVSNSAIRMTRLDLPSLAQAIRGDGNVSTRRPLAFISFALNYRMGGYAPGGYRIANILILLSSVPFAWWFASLLCRQWFDRPTGDIIALGATCIWTLHPLLTNGISYVVQRMTSLCTLFCLIALCCFLQGLSARRRLWHPAAVAAWILALSTKEIAILLPLPVLLYLWLTSSPEGKARRFFGRGLTVVVLMSQAGLIALFSSHWSWNIRPFTLAERLFTEGRVVFRYLTLFMAPLPSRLTLDYEFPLSTSLFSPLSTVASYIFHALLITTAILMQRRRPLLTFSLLSFYLLQLLESTFLPLEIIFEHRAYFPSFFLALALMDLVHWVMQAAAPGREKTGVLIIAIAIAGSWGSMTFQRNKVWASAISLAEDVVTKAPSKPRARHNMGVVLTQEGEYAAAALHLTEALRLEPGKPNYHNSMGSVLIELGRIEEAGRHFSEALRLDPDNAEAFSNLGNTYYLQGDRDEARRHYERARRLKSPYPEADYNMGTLLASEGNLPAAIALYEEALRVQPGYAEAHYNLGVALARQGEIAEAADRFRETVRLDPEHVEAHYNLGVALARQGEIAEAADRFRETIRLDPEHAGARYNLERLTAAPGE
jgi:Flp pilus assembly protein TadD